MAAAVIGVLTTSYPHARDDAAGGFVRQRVRQLLRQGHEVEVLAAGESGLDGPGEPPVFRLGGGALFYRGGAPERLEDPARAQRLAAWCDALGFSGRLLAAAANRGRRWDAVESHWLLPCGLAACVALPDLPHRAHLHGGDVYLLARLPWGDSVGRELCRRQPELVFASSSLRSRFTALVGDVPEAFGARSCVEPAPFDESIFHPRGSEERQKLREKLGMRGTVVLAAGRLVRIKGYDVLLAALARISFATRPRLIIFGEGPERSRLAAQAQATGLLLELPGLCPQAQLAEHLAAADLFVHPCRSLPDGRSEGMPLVVREALACRLPVIASASGGLCDLGPDAAGLCLVPPDDAEALALAMSAFLQREHPSTLS